MLPFMASTTNQAVYFTKRGPVGSNVMKASGECKSSTKKSENEESVFKHQYTIVKTIYNGRVPTPLAHWFLNVARLVIRTVNLINGHHNTCHQGSWDIAVNGDANPHTLWLNVGNCVGPTST